MSGVSLSPPDGDTHGASGRKAIKSEIDGMSQSVPWICSAFFFFQVMVCSLLFPGLSVTIILLTCVCAEFMCICMLVLFVYVCVYMCVCTICMYVNKCV